VDWDAIGAGAELLGALGVIASLLYLAGQVRGNTKQTRLEAARSVEERFSAILLSIVDNSQLAELYGRGVKGLSLVESDGERMQLAALWFALMRCYEESWNYWKQGLLDNSAWKSMESIVAGILSSPGFADWWSVRGSWFSSDFQEYIRDSRPETSRDILKDYLSKE